jgi:hypothetical protein
MRYMFLIYSREVDGKPKYDRAALIAAHWAVMNETKRLGILHGCGPLQPTGTATTVRLEAGKPLVLDGPFAETKEQLAGYYIIECKDLDEAIGWAAKIPTYCQGSEGCIEIRPLANIPPPEAAQERHL